MTNAYLLCRLADTIEDDVGLDAAQKSAFHQRFIAVVKGAERAETFAAELLPLLSDRVLPAERDLVRNAPAVLRVTHGFSAAEQAALTRCVSIMCSGMPEFQRGKSLRGLANLGELASYCYYVAGVVGEMCTELFCLHCPELVKHREAMLRLSVSFGQGRQMTNILKDIWDDRHAGACWLPRSVFADGNFDFEHLEQLHTTGAFKVSLDEARRSRTHTCATRSEYTTLIPKRETGIRRFCLWAIGLAVLTLRKIHRNPTFHFGQRGQGVAAHRQGDRVATNLTLMSNRALRMIFARAADGLPLASRSATSVVAAHPGSRIDVT
jgi:farnesyl-diphosphate farnesyltransferase